jgi:hypothetical protein
MNFGTRLEHRPSGLPTLFFIYCPAALTQSFVRLAPEAATGLSFYQRSRPCNKYTPVLALITIAVIFYLWIDGKRAVAVFVAVAIAGVQPYRPS